MVVWEVDGGFADVEAAGTCLDHLDQACWRAGPDRGPEAATVVCRSTGDGDATSYHSGEVVDVGGPY